MHAKMYLGSQITEKSESREIKNPYNGNVVSTYPLCTREDAESALHLAQQTFQDSKKVPLHQRINWMEDVANRLESKIEIFAKALCDEIAKPIKFARIEVQRAIETIRLSAHAAGNLLGHTIPTDIMPSGKQTIAFTRHEAAGVVVAITPFNFPLNLIIHKIAPALVAGNSVVLKPTPEAPYTAYLLAKEFIESKYATKDALSVVYGDVEVGSTLVTSEIPRIISFTGSVPVGRIIMQSAGIKKVSLELGGNAATLIERSADIAYAASKCALGAFVNSGQVCISLQRIYVEESVYDAFAQKMADESQKLIVGDPYEEETFMSALINEEAAERAQSWVNSALNEGAKVLCGGKREGRVFSPTVMTEVTDEMKIVCEEVFAPIVSLIKVRDFDEALSKINHSPYGLQYSIFTNDLNLTKRAINEFECGGVVINDMPTLRFDVQPYGGVKYSGVGREGPEYALEEMTELKSVVIC